MGRASRAAARAAALALLALTPARLAAETGAPEARPGLALRAALEARSAGRFDEAAAGFDEVERRWPLVGDHAARLAIEARSGAARQREVLEAAAAFAQRYPGSRLGARVARLRGDAAAALGQAGAARAAWREALEGSAEPDARAELLLRLARAEQAAGEAGPARDDYLAAWVAAPGGPDAAAAGQVLDGMEAAGGVPARSAGDWTRRADALFEAGLHAEAVLAYDRALSMTPDAAARATLLRQRAFALFRARRYPEAAAAFEALGPDAEARFWRARAVARSGDSRAAVAAFEALAGEPSEFAERSRLLAATLLEDDPAERERAAAHYAAIADGAADAALRSDARWRLGWLRYRGARAGDAAAQFARLAGELTDPLDALRARYFELRARERAGAAQAGLAGAYASLAGDYPLSYYGWRASLRVEGRASAAPRPPEAPLGDPALPTEPVARIEILADAGLADEADAEIAALAPAARSDADRVALAGLAVAAGSPQRASELVAAGRAAELAQGPVPGREVIWRLAWPRAFESEVAAAAAAEGVPAELVYAIMREESSFRPRALSLVGARGLLQLMPDTARRLAPELGLAPPDADALYDPALNIRLGTRLLGALLREFRGRQSAVVGGYNAGAAATSRWLEAGRELADDEWVEAIPYDETRAYVRRVLRSLHAYRVLY